MSFWKGSSLVETPNTSNFIAIDEKECGQQSLPSSASSTRKPALPETLELNGSEIKRVEKTKYLAIIIDENMNWDEQFNRVGSKINTGLMSLKRLKNILPQSQLCCVYYGLVESHLRYGDVVWGSLNKSKIIALQRLQNRTCCIIENAKIKDSWARSSFVKCRKYHPLR